MRLRWVLTLAFVVLGVMQVAVVVPLALRSLSSLLSRQLNARIDQLMVAVDAESARLEDDVRHRMDELAASQSLEDVARDAAKVPPPAHVTTAASQLMTPRGLDVLALLDEEGRTLSSGHLPARLFEPDDPLFVVTRAPARTVVATLVDVSSASGLTQTPAVVVARSVDYGERRVWAVGGVRLGEVHVKSLARLTGAQAEISSASGVIAVAGEAPAGSVVRTRKIGNVATLTLRFSRADFYATRSQLLTAFLAFALFGVLLSIVLGFAVSARISRPVDALTAAAKEIASGTPGVTVDQRLAFGELKALVDTFNRMTTELKTATDNLVASERVAAWQEVARRLAHEIKNPLTPIRMSLETLLAASQRGQLDDRFRGLFSESARAVLEEVDRLKRIVDEFSQFARLPRPQLVVVDLAELVQPVMALYTAANGLTYETSLSSVRVLADRDQLTQVLVNLVKNAEEAMPTGGCVSVRVRQRGDEGVIEVEDQGAGVPAELKSRLFEPYVTSKPNGTGLGLAIALRIAQEHGGRIEIDDAPVKGALFRLCLPKARAS